MKVVLIVDDNSEYRAMLNEYLSDAFDILEAESGKEAATIWESKKLDAIISDLHMPKGDGFWLLDYLKKAQTKPPIILISGNPDIRSETMIEAGAIAYFPKMGNLEILRTYLMKIVL